MRTRTRPARAAAAAAPGRTTPAVPAPAPPLHRDPWAWLALAALAPLLARCAGAPVGEPVAEDFDFLHRALLAGPGTLLDGGGSTAFWRPLAHQLYYAAFGRLMLAHPFAIAALHAVLLAAATLLVHRALRAAWSGPFAAMAATFPLLSESTRTLIAWPSHFVDLGAYLFVALALHEASQRRRATMLAALLLALWCKEVAVVAVILVPLLPFPRPPEERRRDAIACAALLVAWGAAYLAVRHAAHLALPHDLESDPALLATPWPSRFGWALAASLRALASLTLVPGPADGLAVAIGAGLAVAAAIGLAVHAAARARLRALRTWIAWGTAWFLLSTATLTAIFPLWQPNRSEFGGVGFAIAATATLGAVHPLLAGTLVAGRAILLARAPSAAREITAEAPRTGAFMDFEQLTRLQRFMRATRRALRANAPEVPAHSVFVEANLPHGLLYALGGDHAVEVWYGDSTLRMVNFARFHADTTLPVRALIQYQPRMRPEVVVVPPTAAALQERAFRAIRDGRPDPAVALLDAADAAAPDSSLRVFHASNAGLRAFAWSTQGRVDDALREARRALALDPADLNGRMALAGTLAAQGRLDEAAAEVERLLADHPGDAAATRLAERIARMRAGAAPR